MELYVYKTFAGYLEVTFGLMAAVMIMGYDLKKVWCRVAAFGLVASIPFYFTYYINQDSIRHPVNWALALLIIKLLFKETWWQSLKIIVSSALFCMIPGILIEFCSTLIIPSSQYLSEKFFIISIMLMLPIYTILLLIIYALRRKWGWWNSLWARAKNNTYDLRFFAAIILQLILIFLCFQLSFSGENKLWQKYALYAGWITIIGLNFLIIVAAVRSKERRIISDSESMISSNVNDLVNSVRSQRHDFVNHLQVITALHNGNQSKELGEYLANMNAEITYFNQLLKLDNPFIAALVNAKMARADVKNIKLETDIRAPLSKINRGIFEVVTILGNLMDNAIDAVESLQSEDKWIRIAIYEKGPFLVFEVSNPGLIVEEYIPKLFQPGFTSKSGAHAGLGLYSSHQMARKLGGCLEYTGLDNNVSFSLLTPK